MIRVCKKCGDKKDINLFVKKKQKDGSYFIFYTCIECNKKYYREYNKKYYLNHSSELISKSKEWYSMNLDKKKEYDKNYQEENKKKKADYDKKYREKNRDNINKRLAVYKKSRRLKDPQYRLRKSISYSVWYYMNKNGSSKGNNSVVRFLPYTIGELKKHLEGLFENWMNWDNYGAYHISEWDDDDQSTWTWQIDHIIPQSKLPYTSMDDENFKKCWNLCNLRPLSSKENLLKANKEIASGLRKTILGYSSGMATEKVPEGYE